MLYLLTIIAIAKTTLENNNLYYNSNFNDSNLTSFVGSNKSKKHIKIKSICNQTICNQTICNQTKKY
jgi:hypothetical protein